MNTNVFNPANELTLNDVFNGLFDGNRYKFTFEYRGEIIEEEITECLRLAKFIKETDIMSNLTIEQI